MAQGQRFYVPCARCGATTCPAHRKARTCPECGGNPFTTRERVGQGLILVAFAAGLVLAAHALGLFMFGMHLAEDDGNEL